MSNLIKVQRVMETTFENDTFWIEYQYNGAISYEISSSVDENTDIKILEEAINSNPKLIEKYTNKPHIDSVTNPILKNVIIECLQSDNEMWYVDYDEMEEESITEEDLVNLKADVFNLKLKEDISVDDGEYAICVYGGVITELFF